MTITTRTKRTWDTSAYHRIVAAHHAAGEPVVDFEDGSRARVAAQRFFPSDTTDPDWAGMVVEAYEIVIPSATGRIENPWSRIRLPTDPAFDAHWRAMAAEEDRMIGDRIAALRLDQGLTADGLARRAEVPPETVSRVEAGEVRAGFALLERMLAPLGATLGALIVDGASTAASAEARRTPTRADAPVAAQ